jgi:hypothetical protein
MSHIGLVALKAQIMGFIVQSILLQRYRRWDILQDNHDNCLFFLQHGEFRHFSIVWFVVHSMEGKSTSARDGKSPCSKDCMWRRIPLVNYIYISEVVYSYIGKNRYYVPYSLKFSKIKYFAVWPNSAQKQIFADKIFVVESCINHAHPITK